MKRASKEGDRSRYPRLLPESAAPSPLCRILLVRAHSAWAATEPFATVLPASELEQSAFVALLPKNGLHHASRRLAGRSDVRADRRAVQWVSLRGRHRTGRGQRRRPAPFPVCF